MEKRKVGLKLVEKERTILFVRVKKILISNDFIN